VKKGLKPINTNVFLLSFSHMLKYQQSFELLCVQLWPHSFTHHGQCYSAIWSIPLMCSSSSWPTSSTRTTSSCCTGQSVAEKMLTQWFTFFLYNFLKDGAKKCPFSLLCQETADGKGTIDTI
jgi:hypothetical protein